jgi:hypothetical protein
LDNFQVIEALEDGRSRLLFTSGALVGRIVTAFPGTEIYSEPPQTTPRPFRQESPNARAARLLRSLLSPEQRRDWVVRKRFVVPTGFGRLEFGELYNIGYWPSSGGVYRLCVLPTGPDLPRPDIWTNLLLALKANPPWFFTVANWRRPPDPAWYLGPVPGFEQRT